ncbi:MAG TPA: hypothetical protein PKD24_08420 [Pyrinomonadaceae bacterium]|nr:hypothetical protein [Pyrinomonadaceae bacterium]HMP65908.1 hypothetical protein [Pyrinomonadaceae bacterium]
MPDERSKSDLDDRTTEAIRRVEEKWRQQEEEKSNQHIRELRAKEEQEQAQKLAARSRWINFGLATAFTWVVIMLTDKAIAPEIDVAQSFGKYLRGALALQLLPLIFGWIARKITFTSQKWQIVYWLVLIGVLIAREIVLSRMAA